MVQDVTVKVSKEAYDLSQGVCNVVRAIRKALADGWQPGQDIPVISAALFTDLIAPIQGLGQLAADESADMLSFMRGFELPVEGLAVELLAKP